MKLTNFDIVPPYGIAVESEGNRWDLHNFFAFVGLRQDNDEHERTVSLIWQPYTTLPIPFPGQKLEIEFSGVTHFEVTPRDSEIIDEQEDSCLSTMSRIDASDNTKELIELGIPYLTFTDDSFHLWFVFRGGQCIRIGAWSATLKVI